MPFGKWVEMYGLDDPSERVADLGCGPCDILRYLSAGRRPEFYLGVDISDEYLDAARKRVVRAGVDAKFVVIDLERMPGSPELQQELVSLLEENGITRVLLMGVIHHIDDASARTTLDVIHRAVTVRCLVTSDVITVPGNSLNNLYCKMDRGESIRDEAGYDVIVADSAWRAHCKMWTSPGASFVKYIHYMFEK